MARGGGTGSRTNKKKKTADVVPQNGSVETTRPLKVPQTNGGGGESDVVSNNKHKSKHNNRKQKEETPPAPTLEDETKDEKAKLVPTSEQLRLAQITQSQDNSMDPQRKAKISQVIDITGKSEDEVATALFDCGWDPTKAIEMLLEEGGTEGMGSWEETGKKKKKKNQEDEKTGKENEDWNDDFDPNNKFDDIRERSRQRPQPPRLRNRGNGGPPGVSREDQGTWKTRENQENDRNNFEGGRGRGRGGIGQRGRGGAIGGRGPLGGQRGGRGGGPRGFSDRGAVDGRVVERRDGGRGEGQTETRGGESSFGQIDTWNPVGDTSSGAQGGPGPVQQPGTAAPGAEIQRQRTRPSNKDAFDNAGNWGDDFPAAEDWDNDEYTGSLSDTKVFTPSGNAAPKSVIGEPVNGDPRSSVTSHPPTNTQTQPTAANNSLSGSSYSQPIDLSALLQQKPGALSVAPGGPSALSQYQQAATKDLKSAIGLAPGQGSLSYSSNSGNSSFASAAPGSAFSPIKPAAVTNGSNSGSKALPRARLPPPSKIPSSAVEMPGDSLSNLDVQFGGLDLQFGGSNNDSNSSNFDFGAGTPPSQKQELEKERYSIPSGGPGKPELVGQPTALDSYKPQGPTQSGVKEVNPCLSSALVSAGIKSSSSTDSVPGYGRVGERDTSSSSSSRPGDTKTQYGQNSQQRSPGPLLAKPETIGYNNGPSYAYQGGKTNQGFPSASGYSGSGFERQQSSGYSSSNGLSSSAYGSTGGGSSGYNPPREPSYSATSYGGSSQTGAGSGSTANNFVGYGGAGSTSTTNYSPYAAGSNSYSSSSKSSQQSSQSQYAPVSTSSGPSSQYSDSSTTGSKSSPYDSTQTSSSAVSAYGVGSVGGVGSVVGVGQPSTGSSVTGLGLGANSMVSSSSKMSVNTTSSRQVPGMPPGVPGVLPAQYMIGANAAAGFPYLAGLGQAPAMAAYGYGGHQLEDLAALQRSTLAASLPQLPQNSGYYDPSNQFGGGSGAAASLNTRQNDPTSSFQSDTSGKFNSGGDSTSSPVPSTVAQTQQPTPFNALASTFAAAAPQQHPTLPPGYAYFYGGVGGITGAQMAAAYGGGLQAGGVGYPATHPGIPAPTVAGPTNSTQFQKTAYGSSYGNSYGESLSGLQSTTGYGKTSYGQSDTQPKSGNSSTNAGHGYWSTTNGLW